MRFLYLTISLLVCLFFAAFIQNNASFNKEYQINPIIEVPPLDSTSWEFNPGIFKSKNSEFFSITGDEVMPDDTGHIIHNAWCSLGMMDGEWGTEGYYNHAKALYRHDTLCLVFDESNYGREDKVIIQVLDKKFRIQHAYSRDRYNIFIEIGDLSKTSLTLNSIPERGEELLGIITSQSLAFGASDWDSISGSVYSFRGEFRVKLPL